VIILQIPASGSPTVPSSGSASWLNSSLRLRPTVPPRLQLGRRLAPPTKPPTLLSCSVDRLAPLEPNLPASSSAASSACTAERVSDSAVLPSRLTSSLPTGLPASPSIAPSACASGWISGSASRLLSGLRLLPTVPPHLPRGSSACAVSLASGSAFLPAYFQLAPNCGPFSLAFRSADRLAPSTELPGLPSCLAARLAPCDRPSSLTFLPDCRFPGCLPPPALLSAFSSALASGSRCEPILQIRTSDAC